MYDVSIIGAGVVGGAIARELSKFDLKTCIIEKEEDVSNGASKANSGIIHGGYVAKHGTLKGELCIKGNKMFKELEKELNFGFRETGAIVIGFDEHDEEKIMELYENGLKVGCDDLEIIYRDRIKEIEPYINPDVKVALYSKDVGVASPYELTIALIENAIHNGVELMLETEIVSIVKKEKEFTITTNKGDFKSRYVINAAGIHSDKVAAMVGVDDFKILPRKGQYILLGKDQGHLVNTVVFQMPTKKGKGILVTTTYHNNLMIGPNAEEVSDRDDVATDMESLGYIIETARKSIEDFDIRRALTTFSGTRATSDTGDFIIQESEVKGFINVAGIDSPGLTSSPAIAQRVIHIVRDAGLELNKKEGFDPYRKPILIKKDESFNGSIDNEDPGKNIICRCERITEGEIVEAINRKIPIKSIGAVKRRTRASMGNCQGTFCKPRIKKIIAREKGISVDAITLRGNRPEDSLQRVDINMVRKYKK